jgi:alginate O-acetyltransferase complex protein AlgI
MPRFSVLYLREHFDCASMNFATPGFLCFLLVVSALFYYFSDAKLRKIIILCASYFFYATWNIPFIALLLLSTSIDYFLSQRIASSDRVTTRKLLLTAGIVINLGILALFKYSNFFADSTNQLLGYFLHHGHALRHLSLILPLGISFYTFEAISYLVDVYRGDKPARNFYDYNFYIMYFPHLISGPIVRYHELSSQFKGGIQTPAAERIFKGLELIILGLVFKVIIADTAAGLVDPVFSNLAGAQYWNVWLAWAGFTTQIYFDFMGYTHVARGVSLLFNIELPLNFDHPYNASNISNFWQRWHISLSRWIRDYLFIPMGGSRGTALKTACNLLLTMTIAGAWHGAAWTFIVWGFYHGFLLLVYNVIAPLRKAIQQSLGSGAGQKAYALVSSVLTFLLVSIGWIWFRSPDFSTAYAFIGKLCRVKALFTEVSAHAAVGDFEFIATMATLLVCCMSGPYVVKAIDKVRLGVPYWIKVQIATSALVLCYIFAGTESKPFIYFQF